MIYFDIVVPVQVSLMVAEYTGPPENAQLGQTAVAPHAKRTMRADASRIAVTPDAIRTAGADSRRNHLTPDINRSFVSE